MSIFSDASGLGGQFCASAGLTRQGMVRFAEAERLCTQEQTDGLVLIDAFAGISAARRSLQLLGLSPGSHLRMETDALASMVEEYYPIVQEILTHLRLLCLYPLYPLHLLYRTNSITNSKS